MQFFDFPSTDRDDPDISARLDALIDLLEKADLDSEKAKAYQQRFNAAIERATSYKKTVAAFRQLDTAAGSREDMVENLGKLLANYPLDSQSTKAYFRQEAAKRWLVIVIGLVMITLGMGMIIMPAPPYFEMFTLYYFNDNDGITIMDLISLLVVLCGIYLLVSSLLKMYRNKR